MLILTGKNLGERHRELNKKVSEAADSKMNFDEVKLQEEKSDVDKLFKIDLASRYKKIYYILEILKCGDIFHITRALKCFWLYRDEYSDYINPNYLRNNIFPFMSNKMQRKMLTAASMKLSGDRAIGFYVYCKETKLDEYADKFLVKTPDNFKLDLMKNDDEFDYKIAPKLLRQLLGNSLTLADTYIAVGGYNQPYLHILRYFYSVSDEWYLDQLQKYGRDDAKYPDCLPKLGLKMSKDIIKRHRSRVIEYPVLYINKLNTNILIKYLTRVDVESLAFKLLPSLDVDFWSINYYHTYKFILDKIPANEIFAFLKKIYAWKYDDDSFEFTLEFYQLGYYKLLSVDERETWALLHLERDEELPGVQHYIWYKFVSFKKAFPEIKHYIYYCTDKRTRSQIVNILPETCRNQHDVSTMLNYYYKRHVNESEEYKVSFINKVIEHHDICSFNYQSWIALDKLFSSTSYARGDYKAIAMIYHLIHDIELPEFLKEYISYAYIYHVSSLIDQLSKERKDIVFNYMKNFLTEKLQSLLEKVCEASVKDENEFSYNPIDYEISDCIRKIWNLIDSFKRDRKECPEIVLQYMESNVEYHYHEIYKEKFVITTEEDFVRWLKKDVQLAIEGIREIRCNTYRWIFRLCRLFRKLKVYFSHDVGKEYFTYFIQYLSNIPEYTREYRNIKMAVVGVLFLAEEDYKIEFMEKYVPVTPKIDHINIDKRLLQVQKAICRLAYHSRPPLPLSVIHKYITEDYVHYILPLFNNYLANLPSVEKFIEVVLDAPLSIQKHGLRLAFHSYDTDILKPIIIDAWKRTKNVSLRKLLYETLFDRILNESDEAQKELYEVLKQYTSELNHNDHDDVYSLLVSDDLPDEFKGDLIKTAWVTVSKLPEKIINIKRRLSIIEHMEKYMYLVNRDFPRIQIIDDHLNEMFNVRKLVMYSCSVLDAITEAKWDLTAKYIVSFVNKEEQRQSLELMRYIMQKTFLLWDDVYENLYIARKFISYFVSLIMIKDPKNSELCAYMVPVYRCVLDAFKETLNDEEIYLLTWELKLSIACRKIVHNLRNAANSKEDEREEVSPLTIAVKLSKKITSIVIISIRKGEFYRSFYQPIADTILKIGDFMSSMLHIHRCYIRYFIPDYLTDFKVNETYLLALFMLPVYSDYGWEEEHKSVIAKIKQCDYKEVLIFSYNKYEVSSEENV